MCRMRLEGSQRPYSLSFVCSFFFCDIDGIEPSIFIIASGTVSIEQSNSQTEKKWMGQWTDVNADSLHTTEMISS